MSNWIDIATVTDFPVGSRKIISIGNLSILLFNINHEYYAIRNQCTHENYPLAEATLEGDILTCPLHGAQFCIKTGEVKAPPAFEDLETYPIRVENQMIQIKI